MLEITIIPTVLSAATRCVSLARNRYGLATIGSLATTIFAECLACMVITENSCLWVIYTCVAMFFYYQTIKGWEAYKSRKPNRVYKDYKEIPQGVYYIRTQQGAFKTIPQECVSVYSRQGATVMQNKLTPKPTGTEDTAQWGTRQPITKVHQQLAGGQYALRCKGQAVKAGTSRCRCKDWSHP